MTYYEKVLVSHTDQRNAEYEQQINWLKEKQKLAEQKLQVCVSCGEELPVHYFQQRIGKKGLTVRDTTCVRCRQLIRRVNTTIKRKQNASS